MEKLRRRARLCAVLGSVGCLFMAACFFAPVKASAQAAAGSSTLNEKLVVRYALDETNTAEGQTLQATEWDAESQDFVPASNDATISYSVKGKKQGTVTSVEGKVGTALSFTQSTHARADFHLPADATGMTISLWVKNITTYWSSLIEFWDGAHGGRLGKGTMQGNKGRVNEDDAWDQNCAAHAGDVHAAVAGGGWDSFVVTHNNTNNDNGGAYVDNMKADTWYQLIFTVTATEMKAYRNGVLKQHFNGGGQSTYILGEIMAAAKNQTNGKLGIRLGLDTTENRADVLDELRIYNGAMSEEEIKALHFEYDHSDLGSVLPDTYAAKGLSYPDILLGGAKQVTDAGDGKKTGTTEQGVTYTYTPLTGLATAERDETGVELELSMGETTGRKTLKFTRTVVPELATLGYKIGDGANVPIPVPENAASEITVKVPATADLSQIKAGDIAAQKFGEDASDANYETVFSYDASSHIATVRVTYVPFRGQDTFYTIRFVKKSAATFTSMRIDGGKGALALTPEDFTQNTVNVPVANPADFDLTVTLALAEGATAEETYTFTEADLAEGKLAITVTNENGDAVTYDLVPVAAPSSDASLSALTAQGYELSPAFNKDTTEYTVAIEKSGAEALEALLSAITATPAAGATVQKIYDATEHKIVLTVTAADGTVRRYTVSVIERDADATLKELKAGEEAVAGFDPAVTSYTVKYKGEAPAVTATANSAAAEVSVGAADENGKITVTVTAESGAQRTYEVTLVKMSGDASLKKFTLNGTEIAFTGNAAEYGAPAGTRLDKIAVHAEVAEGASAAYEYIFGENKIAIAVTAEDGTVQQYTVTVRTDAAFADGTTEDNSPETGGCNAAFGGAGAGIAIAAVVVAGALLCIRKRKTR